MAFTDQITIYIKAGDGGNGVVRWRREAGVPKGGPAGGDGGNGGDVYVKAVRDISLLSKYAHKDSFEAEDGRDGAAQNKTGKGGEDLVIDLPVGSVITDLDTGASFELIEDGEERKLLAGGEGGLGNTQFKSSTNRTPRQQTDGTSGGAGKFHIELKLPVDAGFVGFPNAGKSSLVNELTNADSQVGSYEFTTLSPHLGDLYGFVLADIPGLIEGAADGKGLGHTFLRHVSRTKMLVHCVSLENEDVASAYKIIRDELEAYDEDLSDKPEIVVLTKRDTVDEAAAAAAQEEIQAETDADIYLTSIIDDASIKRFRDGLVAYLRSQA
ncbi:MAG: GTPase ObgE [Candidatus Paceibacterota bacterium]